MIENPLLISEEDEEFSPIARLIELGRQKSYVTIDDILHFFPEAEHEVEQLEEAFAALLSAGVAFVEDTPTGEPPEDELAAAEKVEAEAEPDLTLDDYLANIDTDDTIGLYLKEVSRVPLLTANEEVELAQRIERGRMAREELARGNVAQRRRIELRRLIEDGWAAREHLITANSRLVISVAKKYMGRRDFESAFASVDVSPRPDLSHHRLQAWREDHRSTGDVSLRYLCGLRPTQRVSRH